MSDASWFEGVDGQIVVDDNYVWLLRENLPKELAYPFDIRPRRATRSSISRVDLSPADAFGTGLLKIQVEGVESDLADSQRQYVRDGVVFGPAANDEFVRLYALLNPRTERTGQRFFPESEPDLGPPESVQEQPEVARVNRVSYRKSPERRRPSSALDSALRSLDGIATKGELEEALGQDIIVTGIGTSARWWNFGDVWVATGGEQPLPKPKWENEMRLLRQLVDRLGVNPTTGDIRFAIRGSSLARFDLQRLAAVWQEVADAVAPNRSSPPLSAPPSAAPKHVDADASNEPPSAALADVSNTESSGGKVGAGNGEISRSAPIAPRRPGPRHITLAGRKPNPYSGNRIRINLDCGGHYPKALYDFATETIEITAAEHRFVGKRFDGPDEAAAALLDYYVPGTPAPADPWSSWRVDDGSGRTLGDVRLPNSS